MGKRSNSQKQSGGWASRAVLDLLAWATGGHETEYEGLTVFMKDNARRAGSTLQEFMSFALANHVSMLNIETSEIVSRYFAGVSKTTDKTDALGLAYRPIVQSVGRWQGEGSFPRPVLVTVESSTSGRVAVVLVSFRETTARGWGEWNSAQYELLAIEDDQSDAEVVVREFDRAVRHLEELAEFVNQRPEVSQTTKVGGADF